MHWTDTVIDRLAGRRGGTGQAGLRLWVAVRIQLSVSHATVFGDQLRAVAAFSPLQHARPPFA